MLVTVVGWTCVSYYVIPTLITPLRPTGITSGTPWRTGEDERSIRLFQKYTRAQERRDNTPDSRGSGCQGALL